MSGTGTVDNPWDLETALASKSVCAGEHIRLRGGTYTGNFTCTLNGGSHTNPVFVESCPGKRAIINGGLDVRGGYVRIQNLEFVSPISTRETQLPGSTPADLMISQGVRIFGRGIEVVNNVIHDVLGSGINVTTVAADTIVYGNLVCNYGWSGPDRGHGHGIYSENPIANGGRQIISNNIFFNGFCLGIKIYVQSPTPVGSYEVSRNICFNANILYRIVGEQAEGWNIYAGQYNSQMRDLDFVENCTYHARRIPSDQNVLGRRDGISNVRLIGNYWPEGYQNENAEIVEEKDNYFGSVGAPVGNRVFVRPNKYQPGRANVTIYNEAEAESVSIDLSAVTGLQIGDSVIVRNVQDYFVDIQILTLDADKKITVNMLAANRTVSTPIQWIAPATTFPQFGCFVLEKA